MYDARTFLHKTEGFLQRTYTSIRVVSAVAYSRRLVSVKVYLGMMSYLKCIMVCCLATQISCSLLDENVDVNDLLDGIEQQLLARQNEKAFKIADTENIRLKPAFIPFPKPCGPHPCCVPGEQVINLFTGVAAPTVAVAGVDVGAADLKGTCSKSVLLKVNFEKITKEPCDICMRNPFCGRRMLKIELELSKAPRKGRLFNIGDSVSNDGSKGDYNHQQNDAEAEGVYPNVVVYSSDKCKERVLAQFSNAIGPAAHHVTIYVSNNYIRITNDAGFDQELCHECLYALNGQSDTGRTNPGPNEILYIGLNRVITGRPDRNGVGVCSARLSWECPWN